VIRFLLRARYLAVVVVFVFLIHALGLIAVGTLRGFQAYRLMISGEEWAGADRPGIHIAESVDALLFSLILFVLAMGTASLFLTNEGDGNERRIPAWMRVHNLSGLKMLLWEAILMTLVVQTLVGFISEMENLRWQLLILPTAILILSAGLYLTKRINPKNEH
jgi:uncharacterized membrane protein YqhA